MPYKNKEDRNYRMEYDSYHGKPEQIKQRDERNKARNTLVKAGKLRKGDGKDAAHVKAVDKGGSIKDGIKIVFLVFLLACISCRMHSWFSI